MTEIRFSPRGIIELEGHQGVDTSSSGHGRGLFPVEGFLELHLKCCLKPRLEGDDSHCPGTVDVLDCPWDYVQVSCKLLRLTGLSCLADVYIYICCSFSRKNAENFRE